MFKMGVEGDVKSFQMKAEAEAGQGRRKGMKGSGGRMKHAGAQAG